MGTPTGFIHVRRFKYLYTSTVVKSIIIFSPGLHQPSLAAVGLRGLSFRLCGPALSFVGCCGPSWAFFSSLCACVVSCGVWCAFSCSLVYIVNFKKNTIKKNRPMGRFP